MKTKFLPTTRRTAPLRPLFRLLLAACLCLALLPLLPAVPASAESYFDEDMDRLVNWGILDGYEDGSLRPDNPITRAEFAAMVNRAYGFSETGPTPFTDVPSAAWYADDIAIAYNAGYFDGDDAGIASPDAYLTRESALVLLARNMRLDNIPGEVTEFVDGRDFSYWSRGYVKAAVKAGLIDGYEDGTFRPQNYISRGEMSAILSRALGTLVNTPGATTLGNVYGNVTLNQPGSTLQDTVIAGDLIISGGVGLESVTLDNVRVLGNIIVAGGGESNAGETIVLRNVTADQLIVDSLGNKYIALRAEGDTMIDLASLRSNAYVMDHTQSGFGLLNISIDGGDLFTLAGNLEKVVNRAAFSELRIGAGSVQDLTVAEIAPGARLIVDSGAAVRNLNLDTGTAVSGKGDVGTLNVNTAGSSTEMLPDDINIRPGLVSSVAGTEMDSTMAQESSAEPHLMAGYPVVNNLAPTSATATFKTNKAGTVYWAVSTIADGSIGENDLINPPAYATKIVKSGNLSAAASNTEYKANITGLAKGGSYYLSAILVDSRGARSPVKVASFTTPDDTAPDFTGGTPKLTLNKYDKTGGVYVAQVQVIPNKTCQLYWALYASGASAPTATEFRTGNLGGALAHNVMEVTRNAETYVDINNYYTLQEKTEYIVYLWLNDADNGKSSAVKSVKFTTVDGTPPYFTMDLQQNGASTPTSIPLIGTLNENGTIYVVAVPQGTDFITPGMTDEEIQLKISGWKNNGDTRVASAKATANVPATFNVTGLKAETTYDIWYIAQDTAGNYSVHAKYEASTQDTNAPKVTQEFTNPSETENRPYADTGVRLVFNENIQFFNKEYPELHQQRPLDLYNKSTDQSLSQTEQNEARELLAELLRTAISFHGEGSQKALPERKSDSQTTDWSIDFRNVRVMLEGGNLVIYFPNTDDENNDSALNLKSGSTYWFQINGNRIADTSDNHNLISLNSTLTAFTTLPAEVLLEDTGRRTIPYGNDDVTIDMSFSMTPLSARVEDDYHFDVLFWSDTSVTFQLYYRFAGSGTWQAVAVDGQPVEVEITNDNNRAGSYVGVSQYKHFENRTNFPSVVEDLKEIEYAIHFTALGDDVEGPNGSNRSLWNTTVTFQIIVVTGKDGALDNLSAGPNIEKSNLTDGENREGIVQIQTPRDFTMLKSFVNTTAPGFNRTYPRFVPTDTSVTMELALEREGTVYYVIAPASTKIGETFSYSSSEFATTDMLIRPSTGSVVEFEIDPKSSENRIKDHPDDGPERKAVYAFGPPDGTNKVYVPSRGENATGSARNEFELYAPTARNVYGARDNGNSRVKIGSQSNVSTGNTPVTVTGLEPDTLYLVYLVTQGTGQVYSSHAMLYQFSTADVYRPNIYVEPVSQNTSSVNLTNQGTIDARVQYAVFLIDNLDPRFRAAFFTAGNLNEAGEEELEDLGDEDELTKMTVYQAITTPYPGGNGDSYFDRFASTTLKQWVATQVRSSSGLDRDILALNQGAQRLVDCAEMMPDFNQYLFIAIAWYNDPNSPNSTSDAVQPDSIAFRGYSPLYKTDNEPPKLVSIRGNVTVDFAKGTPDYGGGKEGSPINYIVLTFNKPLYYNDPVTNTRLPVVLAKESSTTYRSVKDVISNAAGFRILGTSLTGSTTTATTTITLEVLSDNASVALSGYLCGLSSPFWNGDVIVRLSCPDGTPSDPVTGAPEATVGSDIWEHGIDISIYFNILNRVVPTSVVLTPSSLSIQEGTEGSLTATIYPEAAQKDYSVVWNWENEDGEIEVAGGSVQGRSPGKAKVIVTVKNNNTGKIVPGVSAECFVTVTPKPDASATNMTLVQGEAVPVTLNVTPADAEVKIVQLQSDKSTVAKVGANVGGKTSDEMITAVGPGTATITVELTINGEPQKIKFTVTVVGRENSGSD